MGGQQVQFTGLIAVYHEVLAEVPKRAYIGHRKFG